jgi:hypothetical protein
MKRRGKMFLRILKKDIKRKKNMNIILLIFVILAVTFMASSANNLITVSTALDHYLEKAGIPDYWFATMNTSTLVLSGLGFWKVTIDLAAISGHNGMEVIYLWGMAFAFPTNIQKEVYGCGHRNKKCCACGGQRRTIR